MTDEQLVLYLDAGQQRVADESINRFAEMVEAVKAGEVFARDAKQYARWRASIDRRTRRPARGLEQLRQDFGGNVERGGFEFRQ